MRAPGMSRSTGMPAPDPTLIGAFDPVDLLVASRFKRVELFARELLGWIIRDVNAIPVIVLTPEAPVNRGRAIARFRDDHEMGAAADHRWFALERARHR